MTPVWPANATHKALPLNSAAIASRDAKKYRLIAVGLLRELPSMWEGVPSVNPADHPVIQRSQPVELSVASLFQRRLQFE